MPTRSQACPQCHKTLRCSCGHIPEWLHIPGDITYALEGTIERYYDEAWLNITPKDRMIALRKLKRAISKMEKETTATTQGG